MKKVNEHYFIIKEEEITKEMELVDNGLYVIGEDFYEIGNENDTTPVNKVNTHVQHKQQVSTVSSDSNDNKLKYFVFSVLFLAFFVLCLYNAINIFVANGELNDYIDDVKAEKIIVYGILWLLGGVASLSIGIALAAKFTKH